MNINEQLTSHPLLTALRNAQQLIRVTVRAEAHATGMRPGSDAFKRAAQAAKQATEQRVLDSLTEEEANAALAALQKIAEALGGEEVLAEVRARRGERQRHGRGQRHDRGERGTAYDPQSHRHHHPHKGHRHNHAPDARAQCVKSQLRTQAAFERGFAAGFTQGAQA